MPLRDLEEWPHWPGLFKTVTMLAGLFEPFVFPSQLLWLGRDVDTCLGPWGSQHCAVNWAQTLAGCPLRTGDGEGENWSPAYLLASTANVFVSTKEK